MRRVRWSLALTVILVIGVTVVTAQNPPAPVGRGGQRGTAPGNPPPAPAGTPAAPGAPQRGAAGGGRGGGGGGRGGIQTMTLLTTAWADGGTIPTTYTESGPETSPAIQWGGVPTGTASFVLIFHDIDAPAGNGLDDTLLWLVWNIPGTATGIAQNAPHGFNLPDGSHQISISGPYYRGPGAPATGPFHHYVLELYALDTMLEVQPSPQAPSGGPAPNPGVATRAAVLAAMATHVRGKAAYVGLFHRMQ